jgi:hypothetical protein
MWEKVTPHLQLIGAVLAIPAAAGGTYSVYRNFFAADVACHNLQVSIISVMEKNVPPDVKRGLLIKDVSEFEQKCSKIDPDSHAIFQAAVQPPRPEPSAKPPSSTQIATAAPMGPPVPAARTDGFAATAAPTFGRSASGDVRGWVALTRGEADRIGEPNFDGYGLSLTALPPAGTVLQSRHMVPVWSVPQTGQNDQTKLQGRLPAGTCVRVIATRPAEGKTRTWGEVIPVSCS